MADWACSMPCVQDWDEEGGREGATSGVNRASCERSISGAEQGQGRAGEERRGVWPAII